MKDNKMGDFKGYRSDKTLMKYSAFIISTFTILCVIYAIIKHLGIIFPAVTGAIGAVLGLFTSFFIGLVIAYLVNPLVGFIGRKLNLEGKKRGRLFAVLISYILIIAAIVAMIYMFISMIAGQVVLDDLPALINGLQDQIQSYEQSIQSWIASHPNNILSGKASDLTETVMNWVTKNFSGTGVIATITGFGVSIVNFVIGLIFSIYLMLDKDYFIRLWNRILGLIAPKKKSAINNTLSEVNVVLSQFIRGVCIDAVIVAILSSIALTVYGLQFSVFIGIFAGVCNVIPYFGPVIGMVPAFIIGLLTDNWLTGVIAVIILFAVQQIDANLIYPRVVGSQTGLKPVFVLLAVTIGGGVGGIAGMVLAVPTAGVLKVFFKKWEARREAKLAFAGLEADPMYEPVDVDEAVEAAAEAVSETASDAAEQAADNIADTIADAAAEAKAAAEANDSKTTAEADAADSNAAANADAAEAKADASAADAAAETKAEAEPVEKA